MMKISFNPEDIQNICDLKIGPNHKLYLILVLVGAVSTTVVDLYKGNEDPEVFRSALRGVGLYPVKEEVPRGSLVEHLGAFVVARVKKDANLLHQAIHRQDTIAICLDLGLPQTAAVAYASRRGLLPKGLYPKRMINNPLCFDLSEVGYKNEVTIIEGRMALIRKHAPELYHDLYDHLLAP